jgi:predicted AAA+ superfamily ATPase
MDIKLFPRLLARQLQKTRRSILLLGPRQTGKSTLIRGLKPDLEINLAQESEYFLFQTELEELERRIEAKKPKKIFIDEIQRIPRLTNSIQALIDRNPVLQFILTGSSARKLRRGKANLLPGRLLTFQLAPLSILELGDAWDEKSALRFGTLPGVCTLDSEAEKKRLLSSYTSTYLKEEIMAEALVRQVDGFFRFIQVAALESGHFVDYSKIAKRAKVSRQSVTRHFEILEDTLVARRLDNDPDLDPEQADLVKHPRFYFFDSGVLNAMRGSFELSPERIGTLFEHVVLNQITNTASARTIDMNLHNFRTRGGLEVDFIVKLDGRKTAIECKASEIVSSSELNPLRELSRYYPKIRKLVFYRGKRELKDGDIWILPLKKGIENLF